MSEADAPIAISESILGANRKSAAKPFLKNLKLIIATGIVSASWRSPKR